MKEAKLALADGTVLRGQSCGVGGTPGSTAQLDLAATNRIDASDRRVEKHGKPMATTPAPAARRWHFGDSARVELSGRALDGLR